MKGITFPSFAWKKCFSSRKVRWRIEATFFTGDCIVASRESLVRQKRWPRGAHRIKCGAFEMVWIKKLREWIEETKNYSISENLEIELFENIIKLLLKYSSSLQINYLLVNLVSVRRTVLLAEFLIIFDIFALKMIFNYRSRHGTSEEKRESKMNLRSHFAQKICTNPNKLHIKTLQITVKFRK